MWWKHVFDARHQFGIYCARVAFVEAPDLEHAQAAAMRDAQVSFAGMAITTTALLAVPESAMLAHEAQRARLGEWLARTRAARTLLCPQCDGTGRAAKE